MLAKIQREDAELPCKCLEQAFCRVRSGDENANIIACTSDNCPINEIAPNVVDDFLKLIGGMADEPMTPCMVTTTRVRAISPQPRRVLATRPVR
jgi:hypothetical protein